MRMDVRHPPDNVTPSHPTQGACSIDAGASELTPANVSSVQTNQHGLGQGVKRMRFAEHEPNVTASTSGSRNTDNNGMY